MLWSKHVLALAALTIIPAHAEVLKAPEINAKEGYMRIFKDDSQIWKSLRAQFDEDLENKNVSSIKIFGNPEDWRDLPFVGLGLPLRIANTSDGPHPLERRASLPMISHLKEATKLMMDANAECLKDNAIPQIKVDELATEDNDFLHTDAWLNVRGRRFPDKEGHALIVKDEDAMDCATIGREAGYAYIDEQFPPSSDERMVKRTIPTTLIPPLDSEIWQLHKHWWQYPEYFDFGAAQKAWVTRAELPFEQNMQMRQNAGALARQGHQYMRWREVASANARYPPTLDELSAFRDRLNKYLEVGETKLGPLSPEPPPRVPPPPRPLPPPNPANPPEAEGPAGEAPGERPGIEPTTPEPPGSEPGVPTPKEPKPPGLEPPGLESLEPKPPGLEPPGLESLEPKPPGLEPPGSNQLGPKPLSPGGPVEPGVIEDGDLIVWRSEAARASNPRVSLNSHFNKVADNALGPASSGEQARVRAYNSEFVSRAVKRKPGFTRLTNEMRKADLSVETAAKVLQERNAIVIEEAGRATQDVGETASKIMEELSIDDGVANEAMTSELANTIDSVTEQSIRQLGSKLIAANEAEAVAEFRATESLLRVSEDRAATEAYREARTLVESLKNQIDDLNKIVRSGKQQAIGEIVDAAKFDAAFAEAKAKGTKLERALKSLDFRRDAFMEARAESRLALREESLSRASHAGKLSEAMKFQLDLAKKAKVAGGPGQTATQLARRDLIISTLEAKTKTLDSLQRKLLDRAFDATMSGALPPSGGQPTLNPAALNGNLASLTHTDIANLRAAIEGTSAAALNQDALIAAGASQAAIAEAVASAAERAASGLGAAIGTGVIGAAAEISSITGMQVLLSNEAGAATLLIEASPEAAVVAELLTETTKAAAFFSKATLAGVPLDALEAFGNGLWKVLRNMAVAKIQTYVKAGRFVSTNAIRLFRIVKSFRDVMTVGRDLEIAVEVGTAVKTGIGLMSRLTAMPEVLATVNAGLTSTGIGSVIAVAIDIIVIVFSALLDKIIKMISDPRDHIEFTNAWLDIDGDGMLEKVTKWSADYVPNNQLGMVTQKKIDHYYETMQLEYKDEKFGDVKVKWKGDQAGSMAAGYAVLTLLKSDQFSAYEKATELWKFLRRRNVIDNELKSELWVEGNFDNDTAIEKYHAKFKDKGGDRGELALWGNIWPGSEDTNNDKIVIKDGREIVEIRHGSRHCKNGCT